MPNVELPYPGHLVFEFYHVGQGDNTLVQFPSGQKFAIIDSKVPPWLGGCPAAHTLKAITTRNRTCELAFVCVSHPHFDHVQGMAEILEIEHLCIREFWHPLLDIEELLLFEPRSQEQGEIRPWDALDAARRFYYEDMIGDFVVFAQKMEQKVGKQNVRQVRAVMALPDIDGVQIYAINPTHSSLQRYKAEVDNSYGQCVSLPRDVLDNISIAFVFVFGDNAILYASDMQREQWRDVLRTIQSHEILGDSLPVRALKASHHGGPRSYFDSLWSDILGPHGGLIVVSGGTATHPCPTFISSVRKSGRRPRCTGMAQVCRSHGFNKAGFGADSPLPSKHWLNQYAGEPYEHGIPCYGDIQLVVPKTGRPLLNTKKKAKSPCPIPTDLDRRLF